MNEKIPLGDERPKRRTIVDLLVEAVTPWLDGAERAYDRNTRAVALRRRRDWHKADLPRLLRLPGRASSATQQSIARLYDLEGVAAQGRPIIGKPKKLPDLIGTNVEFYTQLWAAGTPPGTRRKLYKETKWFPYFVEAAYRGELSAAQREAAGIRKSLHHDTSPSPSELAKAKVAKAAGISESLLDKLCGAIRLERKGEPPNATRDDPETSAAELARHLEQGPTPKAKRQR